MRRAMMGHAVAAGGGGNPNAYLFYRTIIIDHTQVGSTDSTDFPLLVSFTDATLKTVGNGGHVQSSSGWDIGFYSDSALTTKLDWEIERWIGTTGEVIYWVRVPTVSHTADTVIYMAYDSTTVTTDQSNKTGVWDSKFAIVYHWRDGTTLSLLDSTSNGRTETNNNVATAGAGMIGGGMVLNGTTQFGSTNYAPTVTDVTIAFWINLAAIAGVTGLVSWASAPSDSSPAFLIQQNAGLLKFFVQGAYRELSQTLSTSTWYRIVMTGHSSGASSTWKFYLNASLLSTYTGSNFTTAAPTIYVGSGFSGVSHATVDELQISVGNGDATAARSSDWITADYNNQKAASTLVTVGAETST